MQKKRRNEPDKTSHWLVLLICLGALGLAAFLDPAKQNTEMVTVAGFPVPPICGMKRITGLPCPGCGLTRSWVAAAHGDLALSLQFNRMGWLLMLYTALQALRHALVLGAPTYHGRLKPWGRLLDKGLIPLAILLALNWVVVLVQLFW